MATDPDFVTKMLDILDRQTALLCQPHTQERDIAIIHTTREITLTLKSFHEASNALETIVRSARTRPYLHDSQ